MRPEDHPAAPAGKVAILLINLGSPDEPTPGAVRRYLAQFLSDRRVVEIPALLWKPILYGAILTTRPKASAANYAKVWDRAANDSPLRVNTREQAKQLEPLLGVRVDFAMRYGNPAIADRLAALKAEGFDRILLAPLYPQYSSATTGTALQAAFDALAAMRWMPAIATLPPYHDHPAYIAALAASVRAQLSGLDHQPERILLSFHGMPRRTLDLGDPYYCHCRKTARLLRAALGMDDLSMPLAFQSRFGRAAWLQPYTEPLLRQLAADGVRRVAVLMPGFSADCVETLEEIALEARHSFLSAGGTHFTALSCLNATQPGMAMLARITGDMLAAWRLPG